MTRAEYYGQLPLFAVLKSVGLLCVGVPTGDLARAS
jgi:hypothetical protein